MPSKAGFHAAVEKLSAHIHQICLNSFDSARSIYYQISASYQHLIVHVKILSMTVKMRKIILQRRSNQWRRLIATSANHWRREKLCATVLIAINHFVTIMRRWVMELVLENMYKSVFPCCDVIWNCPHSAPWKQPIIRHDLEFSHFTRNASHWKLLRIMATGEWNGFESPVAMTLMWPYCC